MAIVTPDKLCKKCGGEKRHKDGRCVYCRSAAARKYRESNQEKVKERKRIYRINNIEKVNATRRKWLSNNKERVEENRRAWRNNNPEKVRAQSIRNHSARSEKEKEYSREWRRNNPEKVQAQQKRYWIESHDKAIEKTHRRRARIYGNGGDYTAKEWNDLLDLYGHKCLCCGRDDVQLTVDHIVPISAGGRNEIDNIQPLCKSCNSVKNVKVIDYRPARNL